MANAPRDNNHVPALLGVSSADGTTPIAVRINPATGRVLAEGTFTSDGKLKVSSNDSTPGYLNGKLVAGTSISLTEGNDGADETLTVAVTGLVIGTDVQAFDATLTSLALLGTAGDKFAYTTGVDTWAEGDITAFGRSLIDDANAAAAQATLGLGTLALQNTVDNGDWSGTDLAVENGGTGASSFTAYAVTCGGTTGTAALQSVSGVGTADQVLTSNGAGALPTWQDAGGGDLFSTDKFVYAYRFNVDVMQSAVSGTGTITNQGWGVEVSTGATASSNARLSDPAYFWNTGYDKDIKVRWRVSAITATNNSDILMYGMPNADNVNTATKYAGFRINSSGGTDTAYAVSKDGTTEEATDVTVSLTLGSALNDLMVILDAGTNVKFYINGTLVATHSTNIPPAADTTTTLPPIGFAVNNNADAVDCKIRIVSCVYELTL